MSLNEHLAPGLSEIYIGHPEGWDEIVESLDAVLSALDPDYVLHQTKEKFGGLRFYAMPSENTSKATREAFAHAKTLAIRLSFHVCEVCGKEGKYRGNLSWVRTLCNEHYKEI